MGPPTNLPSWRDVNRIIVNALATGREDFAAAIELAQTELPLVRGKSAAFAANPCDAIGRANLRLGLVRRAEDAYREGIAALRDLGIGQPLAAATQNLGTTLALQQRDDEAASAFAVAAEAFRLLDDAENLAHCTLCEATTP